MLPFFGLFGRVARWSRGVGPEPLEVAAERVELGPAEAGTQPAVEGDDRVEQGEEERLAGVGELDELRAAVLRRATAGHQAGVLHPLEVVGERRALDADGGRDVALHGVVVAHQRCRDQPHR